MKVSVSIPSADLEYLDAKVRAGDFLSRSAALHTAVTQMRQREHADSYAAAWDEWDGADQGVWDKTATDGLI
jgi:Arc/MetJ-type ribon-helix-helix transcriptional regulator